MTGITGGRRRFAWKQIVDPGASGTIRAYEDDSIVELVSAAAETRTLPAPLATGVRITLHMKTDGGDITLTVTGGYNELGSTTLVFGDAGQKAVFESVNVGGTLTWRMVYTNIPGASTEGPRFITTTNAATYTVLAVNSGKTHIVPDLSASCTFTLPTALAGLEYVFISKAVAIDAHDWIFSTGGANFFLGGLAFADTDAGAASDEIAAGVFPNGTSNDFMTIVAPGGGTRIHLICDGSNWIVNGQVFSATTPAFSDT